MNGWILHVDQNRELWKEAETWEVEEDMRICETWGFLETVGKAIDLCRPLNWRVSDFLPDIHRQRIEVSEVYTIFFLTEEKYRKKKKEKKKRKEEER